MSARPRWAGRPRRASGRTGQSCERGSATVLGLAVMVTVLTMWTAALVLGAVVLGGGRARSGADLAAVGGAQVLLRGQQESSVCARAAQVAAANGTDLVSCSLDTVGTQGQGPSIEVVVEAATGVSAWPVVQARARAGLVPGDP